VLVHFRSRSSCPSLPWVVAEGEPQRATRARPAPATTWARTSLCRGPSSRRDYRLLSGPVTAGGLIPAPPPLDSRSGAPTTVIPAFTVGGSRVGERPPARFRLTRQARRDEHPPQPADTIAHNGGDDPMKRILGAVRLAALGATWTAPAVAQVADHLKWHKVRRRVGRGFRRWVRRWVR